MSLSPVLSKFAALMTMSLYFKVIPIRCQKFHVLVKDTLAQAACLFFQQLGFAFLCRDIHIKLSLGVLQQKSEVCSMYVTKEKLVLVWYLVLTISQLLQIVLYSCRESGVCSPQSTLWKPPLLLTLF